MPQEDVIARLRAVSSGYSDRLGAPARRAILDAAVAGASRPVPFATHMSRLFRFQVPQMAMAAAVVFTLVSPVYFTGRGERGGAAKEITNLTVTTVDGDVVLSWHDGDQPRRVLRATSREELARMAERPGQVVTGERWMDRTKDDAQIVYYVVQ